jgi:hypothetical protein
MVATSRKFHPGPKTTAGKPPRESAPDPAPDRESGVAPGSEAAPGGSVAPKATPGNLRALYDHLLPHLGRWRAEAINGRLVMSPVGTPEHQWISVLLTDAFMPLARERGWRVFAGLDVCLPGSRDPYEPDFVMAPKNAPRWGDREIFTDGLVMVGEVVSKGSAEDDRDHKPGIYAGGGVPVMLLIDVLCEPPAVTVYSHVKEGRYSRTTRVELGEKLHIPDPVGFDLDTSIFLDD